MQLTASERIILFPDGFTEEGGMLTSKVELPDGRKLASERLGRAVMQAAILSVEAAGGLELEVRQGKALFGLMKTRKLYAAPRGQAPAFPEGSLEAAVAAQVAVGDVEVGALVQALIGEEQADPAAWVVTRVQRGLAERGLLATEEGRVLKVFAVMKYVLTDATHSAAAAEGIASVESLLASAQRERPEVWSELDRAVRSGITFMTESSGD